MAENERELSQFLYHVTEEIITSGDYSDCNINRICGKYYDSSSYSDRERLRRLVAELKHKLQLYQRNEFGQSSTCGEPKIIDELHRCSCQRSRTRYNPYPAEEKTMTDKCIETTTDTSRFFVPTKLLVSDSTQYSEQHSVATFYSNGSNYYCDSCRNLQEPLSVSNSPRSSDESNTLIEQLLLKHVALDGNTSSEILMRLAAGDRVLCESCHGKCPLHRCQGLPGPAPPPTCPGRCNCGPTCGGSANYTGKKKPCECPLRQCKHMDVGAGSSGEGSGSLAPILRQGPPESLTPPATCCGARRKRTKSACGSKRSK